jgi:hypothetical protein
VGLAAVRGITDADPGSPALIADRAPAGRLSRARPPAPGCADRGRIADRRRSSCADYGRIGQARPPLL